MKSSFPPHPCWHYSKNIFPILYHHCTKPKFGIQWSKKTILLNPLILRPIPLNMWAFGVGTCEKLDEKSKLVNKTNLIRKAVNIVVRDYSCQLVRDMQGALPKAPWRPEQVWFRNKSYLKILLMILVSRLMVCWICSPPNSQNLWIWQILT